MQQARAWAWLAAAVGQVCLYGVEACLLGDMAWNLGSGFSLYWPTGIWRVWVSLLMALGELVLIFGAWWWCWSQARALRRGGVAWLATGLAAVAVGRQTATTLAVGINLWVWATSTPRPSLVWLGPVFSEVYGILWNVVAAGVLWPLVARMAWRGRR